MAFTEDLGRYGLPAILAVGFAAWCKPWTGTKECSPGTRLANAAIGWLLGYGAYRGIVALAERAALLEVMPTSGYIPEASVPRMPEKSAFDLFVERGAIDAEIVGAGAAQTEDNVVA